MTLPQSWKGSDVMNDNNTLPLLFFHTIVAIIIIWCLFNMNKLNHILTKLEENL